MSDCQSVCVSDLIFYEAYDITMPSVYLRISPNFFLFLYAVRVVSKESKRLFLPRTSC
jgi:hypothetical protein